MKFKKSIQTLLLGVVLSLFKHSTKTGYRFSMGVMTLHLLNYDNVYGFPPSFVGWKASVEAIAK